MGGGRSGQCASCRDRSTSGPACRSVRGGRAEKAAPCRGSARRRRTCRVRAGGRFPGGPGLRVVAGRPPSVRRGARPRPVRRPGRASAAAAGARALGGGRVSPGGPAPASARALCGARSGVWPPLGHRQRLCPPVLEQPLGARRAAVCPPGSRGPGAGGRARPEVLLPRYLCPGRAGFPLR